MDQIYETNDKFNFNELHISKPISSTTGAFISKYSINEKPLYIQPPKCSIKQMVTKTGKRMYCDLVFQQENENFIRWIENLENNSHKMIYTNREKWFQTELEMSDIENSFTSPIKIYKSGRSYIVRTNIPSRLGKPIIKIYDEDEKDIPYEDVKDGAQVMVILEVQGIRCSARSFQIDIEMKQMMVIRPTDLFNTCILKKKPIQDEREHERNHEDNSKTQDKRQHESESESESFIITDDLGKDEAIDSFENQDKVITELPVENVDSIKINTDNTGAELQEIDFNLDEMQETETVSIKQRNDVYYKMYHEAREKAKIARDLALSAYLEAKRIKNTYMLDDIIDSSDSESESGSDSGSEEEEDKDE